MSDPQTVRFPLWQRMRTNLVEVIYPRTCAGCGMRGTWLCDGCVGRVARLDHGICFRCGAPIQPVCLSCTQLDSSISMARALYPYTGWVPDAVKGFKYGNEWSRGPDLGHRMAAVLSIFGPVDVVVPVPLHPRKLVERGYNQAELLAQVVADELQVPCSPVLIRTRKTDAQARLDRDDRLENVRGAFAPNPDVPPIAGLRYLLVDDVRTTGSTLNACAVALTGLVPARISALSFALDLPARELRQWMADHG